MKKISLIILLFTFFITALNAEIVSKIEINGNQRISDETIRIYGKINIGKEISENEINGILNNLYSTDFFENIDINIKDNTLVINLKEYPSINKLIFSGEQKKTYIEEIKNLIRLKEKKIFY